MSHWCTWPRGSSTPSLLWATDRVGAEADGACRSSPGPGSPGQVSHVHNHWPCGLAGVAWGPRAAGVHRGRSHEQATIPPHASHGYAGFSRRSSSENT